MNHYIFPIAPPREGILLEGVFLDGQGLFIDCSAHGKKTAKRKPKKIKAAGLEGTAVLKCGVEGVIAKPYPGDIYPRPPFPKEGGSDEITVRTEGFDGIKPVDPDWFMITVRIKPEGDGISPGETLVEGARDAWPGFPIAREGWGGGNHEIYYGVEGYLDVEGHQGGINTGGGTGCSEGCGG